MSSAPEADEMPGGGGGGGGGWGSWDQGMTERNEFVLFQNVFIDFLAKMWKHEQYKYRQNKKQDRKMAI